MDIRSRNELFDLTGEVALLTGGASGLGRCHAEHLAEFGADVVIADLNLEAAEKAAAELARDRQVKTLAVKLDVSKVPECYEAVERTVAEFGKLDILVNNAGINIRQLAVDVTEEAWDKIVDVNLKGTFFMSQAAGKVMIPRRHGKIINMSSQMEKIALPKRAAYCATKGGVSQLTKLLAVEWAQYGICVNAIAPSFFTTPMNKELFEDPEFKELIYTQTPMGRPGDPADLGGAIVYLASRASDYVTGHTLFIDGGFTIR